MYKIILDNVSKDINILIFNIFRSEWDMYGCKFVNLGLDLI